MFIREITSKDAESLVQLIKQVESESDFMLMEGGERQITADQQRMSIEKMDKESNSTIFVAEHENGELVGYLYVIGGAARRVKHTAYLVIGILEKYRGQGIGTKLFAQLDEWAISRNILRLELTVATPNDAGIALYTKMGFEIEGTKRHSLLVKGNLIDQYYMAKLF